MAIDNYGSRTIYLIIWIHSLSTFTIVQVETDVINCNLFASMDIVDDASMIYIMN